MRERLVAAFVGLTVVVVALYGIPRAYFLADLVHDEEQERLDRTAALVAVLVQEHADHGEPVTPAFLDELADSSEHIQFTPRSGPVVRSSDFTTAGDGDVVAEVESPEGAITVSRDGDEVDDAIARALLPLVVLGLVLVLLAAVAGAAIARRIARPFQELADAARGLGAGELHPDLPDYKVPEAREIAQALATSGDRLDDLLRHERDLTVRASHELRTPITALHVALEDLALWPETPPTVAAEIQRAVGELDRLSSAVTELLAVSRDHSAAAEIDLDLDALVSDTIARVAALGRRVTHVPSGPLPTHLDPAPVVEALELLVGGGSEVRASDRGTYLEVSVTTAGQDATVAARQRDRAAHLVAAAGGSLTRTDDGVVLRLPKRPLVGA